MSGMENGRNGFEKGKYVKGKEDFYELKRGLVHVPACRQLFAQKTLTGEELNEDFGFYLLAKRAGARPGEAEEFMKRSLDMVAAVIEKTGNAKESEEVTISKEGFEKLINPYGRMLGISDDTMARILGGLSGSNGDVIMAQVKHAYADVCAKRGSVPRGYQG